MNILPVVLLALGSAFALCIPAAANQQTPRRDVSELQDASCTVCPKPIDGEGVEIRYRGRTLRFHPGACEHHWTEDPDGVFARVSPRGANFAESPSLVARLRDGWFGFGTYVLVGLLSGAACAYIAVGRGRVAASWFFLGLLFNVLALLAVLVQRKLATRDPEGVPSGMNKVPVTRTPLRCNSCGSENHPSATQCLACGSALKSTAASELSFLRPGETA